MTIARLDINKHSVKVDLASSVSLAIPLAFDADQPAFFGAPPASRQTLQSGNWVGDTRQGGTCNAEVLTLTPHCNGTHTECIGHIVDQDIAVADAAPDNLIGTWLISVTPESARKSADPLADDMPKGQKVISRALLEAALKDVPPHFAQSIIIRTLPNVRTKRSRNYTDGKPVPFITAAAADLLVDLGCEHLLLDVPSMDYGSDEHLTAHRIFFGLPAGSRDYRKSNRRHCTITEMIFAPDDVEDGAYLLNLQIPAFLTEAAPSRPLIYRIIEK